MGSLRDGVLIDTSFGGVVHYPEQKSLDREAVTLTRRQDASSRRWSTLRRR